MAIQVRELWKALEETKYRQSDDLDIVKAVLDETLDKHQLHAADLNVCVPDMLLRECEKEIQRVGVLLRCRAL
jgi:hypothetical protein